MKRSCTSFSWPSKLGWAVVLFAGLNATTIQYRPPGGSPSSINPQTAGIPVATSLLKAEFIVDDLGEAAEVYSVTPNLRGDILLGNGDVWYRGRRVNPYGDLVPYSSEINGKGEILAVTSNYDTHISDLWLLYRTGDYSWTIQAGPALWAGEASIFDNSGFVVVDYDLYAEKPSAADLDYSWWGNFGEYFINWRYEGGMRSGAYRDPQGRTRILEKGKYSSSAVFGGNDFKQMIGVVSNSPETSCQPALWDGHDLVLLDPAGISLPLGIDDDGHVVGIFAPRPIDATQALELSHGDLSRFDSYVDSEAVLWENGVAIDLNTKVPPGWRLLAALFINDLGQIGCVAERNGVRHFVVLEPCNFGIAVDADRDGSITVGVETNPDATSSEKPYRFWLNDDNDATVTYTNADQLRGIIGNLANLIPNGGGVYEIEQDDQVVTDSSQEDWRKNTVACKRDLEDFARIVVSASGLTDAIKNGDLYLGLKWANTTGTPAIKLYKQYDAAGGQSYVMDDYQASVQLPELSLLNYQYPNDDRSSASAHTTVETSEVFVIAPGIWFGLTESASKRSLLFEGCKAGSGQLKLVILKRQNDTYTEIGEGGSVWLDLKEPKEFIERWSCGDGDRTAIGPLQRLDAKSGTFADPTQDSDKDYVLYVHGYNMQENEKQRWLETTYKRLWHLGYKGRVGGFSWPCSQTAPPYDDSENHAWQSGARLAELLANLKAHGFRVHLLAHSQGNVVAGEALRLAGAGSQVVRTYVASQAAIAGHSYDSSLESRTDFTPSTPDVYSHYYLEGQNPAQSTTLAHTWPSTNPSYLAPSRMTGAAVKYVNFWNADDYALTGNSLGHPGWMIDQAIKPTVYPTGYNLDHGFYYYDPFTMPAPNYYAFPDDRFTIFAVCLSARSRALGATQTGGVFAANPSFDLKASLSYGTEHIYHSAEFRSSMAQRWQYWNRFLIEAGLKSPQ